MPPNPAEQFRNSTRGAGVELGYAGINTFLKGDRLPIDALSEVDAAVIGAPYDAAVSNRPGARYGPEAVRRASSWWAYLSDYKGGLTNMQTGSQVNFDDLTVGDCGDVPVFPTDQQKTAQSIEAHVAAIAEQTFPVLIGGDHYCTFPSFSGFAKGSGSEKVGLVQIDAHSDTVSESSVFGAHFHGSSTNLINESPYASFDSISQIAIRGYESPDFFDFAEQEGLNLYTMRTVMEKGIVPVVEDAFNEASKDTDTVYVTFDIDAVDPAVAPGTGTPTPGGLSSHQSLKVMEVLGTKDQIGMIDLMEVAPNFDQNSMTSELAAYLLVTFLERRFAE